MGPIVLQHFWISDTAYGVLLSDLLVLHCILLFRMDTTDFTSVCLSSFFFVNNMPAAVCKASASALKLLENVSAVT